MSNTNKPHLCPDWDFLFIVPGNPEMSGCTCNMGEQLIPAGAKLKTDFYLNEKNSIRIVKSCYPAPVNSQSGWYITTACGLSCDAEWFRAV